MSKNSGSPKNITGKTTEELAKNIDSELKRLWTRVNELAKILDNTSVGERNMEEKRDNIRLIQANDKYYLEARFKDGWARLTDATGFKILTKKD